MATTDDTTATLDVKFVPDEYSDIEKAEGASWPLGAGTYFVGVNYKGAFLPIAKFGGGKVNKLVELAKQAQDSQQSTQADQGTTGDPTATPPAAPPASTPTA